MKSNKPQQGSAHLIVIIILVIALLGALGFVFWQNFIQQPNQIAKSNELTEIVAIDPKLIELSEIATDVTTNSGLAIKYPKTWILSNSTIPINHFSRDKTTITSPDGSVTVVYDVELIGGRGGVCKVSEDGQKLTQLVQLDADVITGYPDARFVAYVDHNTLTDVYKYSIGVQGVGGYGDHIKVGDVTDDCDSFGSISSSPSIVIIKNPDDMLQPNVTLNIELNNVQNGVSSLTDINNAMKTDNFLIAKRIVQSLYVK